MDRNEMAHKVMVDFVDRHANDAMDITLIPRDEYFEMLDEPGDDGALADSITAYDDSCHLVGCVVCWKPFDGKPVGFVTITPTMNGKEAMVSGVCAHCFSSDHDAVIQKALNNVGLAVE
jgi:Rieske Fe-S protein